MSEVYIVQQQSGRWTDSENRCPEATGILKESGCPVMQDSSRLSTAK